MANSRVTDIGDVDRIDHIDLLRRFLAVESIPANALRNQGKGVPQAIQRGVARIDIRSMATRNLHEYTAWLDTQTEIILQQIRAHGRPWGTVRKAINLFMRACICNHYVREEYGLVRIETFAELPMDSIVAGALKRDGGRGQLPQWPGLKNLNLSIHALFQGAASRMAERLNLNPRFLLDNHLWLTNRLRQP